MFNFIKKFFKKNIKNDLTTEIANIQLMFDELKREGNLDIRLSNYVKNELLEIANLRDWHKQIDKETLEKIKEIYARWICSKNMDIKTVNISSSGGFNVIKYWEGTQEEYLKALENKEIDENTRVRIYRTEKYIQNDNGYYEEVE